MKRSIISEPINIVTGSLGSGKTLWAIEQADLLRIHKDAENVYQVGINEPDTRYLPNLPFPLEEWADRADSGELRNAVIIVDEFHQWMPQRSQNSRPPRFIEQMAEARRRDVRFILLTQSSEFDHFLKGTRLNKHFYLSRKAGLKQSNLFEWSNRFVSRPEEDKDARASAVKHLAWRHPIKKYGSWYVSAKAHRFRRRIPFRIMLVPPFIAVLGYFAWKTFVLVGGMMSGEVAAAVPIAAAPVSPASSSMPIGGAGERVQVLTRPDDYLAQFQPVIATMPFSAPAFQGRPVLAEPELLCSIGHAGTDGNGDWQDESCSCYTEQMTPYEVEDVFCRLVARQGMYNPYRAPLDTVAGGRGGESDSSRPARLPSSSGVVLSSPQVTGYGDLATAVSPPY